MNLEQVTLCFQWTFKIMNMNINQFKVGDNLYKHGSFVGVLKYVITTISENSMELECLSCNDHPNCKLIVKLRKGKIVFGSMLNNPEESYWHNSKEPKCVNFYTSFKEYAHKVSAISIGKCVSKIEKLQKELISAQKEKESYVKWLKELDEKGYN